MKLIKFGAEWCGPCKTMDKILDKVLPDYPDLEFERVDVDENQNLAAQNQVKSVPTFIFYDGESEVHRFVGAVNPQKLKDTLNDVLTRIN